MNDEALAAEMGATMAKSTNHGVIAVVPQLFNTMVTVGEDATGWTVGY